jgi:hypothetical protein
MFEPLAILEAQNVFPSCVKMTFFTRICFIKDFYNGIEIPQNVFQKH